jgi:hypothetical protein
VLLLLAGALAGFIGGLAVCEQRFARLHATQAHEPQPGVGGTEGLLHGLGQTPPLLHERHVHRAEGRHIEGAVSALLFPVSLVRIISVTVIYR